MPGYIIHLAAARLALDKLGFLPFDDKFKIYTGSILADTMARESKKESHFWSDDSLKLLKRAPEIERFEAKYESQMDNPIVDAYMTHLYMDKKFVDEYWSEHFEFYNDDMKPEEGYDEVTRVRLKDTGRIFLRSEFLSDEYYYGDYTRLLPYITHKYGLKEIFGGYGLDVIKLMLDKLDCSVIEEIKNTDYKRRIMGMFESIYNTEVEEYPKLKIFDLSELEKLINETADYMKRIYVRAHMQ